MTPDEKISINQQNYLVRLFRETFPSKRRFFLLLLLSALASVLSVLPTILLQQAIDKYIMQGNSQGLWLIVAVILLIGFLSAGENYIQQKLSEFFSLSLVKNLRNRLFEHITNMPFEFFDQTSTGEMVARITSDTEQLTHFITQHFIQFIINICMLFGIFTIFVIWDVRFGLFFLILFPLLFMSVRIYARQILPINRTIRRTNGMMMSSIHENFDGIREIKLYGREDFIIESFLQSNTRYFDSVIAGNRATSKWGSFPHLLLNVFMILLLLMGGYLVIEGSFTLGQLVAAISYVARLGGPFNTIMSFTGAYNNTKAAAERVFDIIDQIPTIRDNKKAIPMPVPKGDIEFCNVCFHYKQSGMILHHVSFTASPGQVIAIVGPSGVGKTTLVHLIPRFYDFTEGEILIDGVDIRQFQLKTLRKNVGIVMQNVFLFDGTIRENIAYARPDASMEEIRHAARVAQMDDFIESLPAQYESRIGERGVKLSGGQAQRLSIARVMLTDPKLLILDEPTANVDAITDQHLIHAVQAMMMGRTTLIIAHRLWTIQNADKILLLQEGEVQGFGTHAELMQNNEFYRVFFASQLNLSKGENRDRTSTEVPLPVPIERKVQDK